MAVQIPFGLSALTTTLRGTAGASRGAGVTAGSGAGIIKAGLFSLPLAAIGSIVGGAMSLAGGVLRAGSTVAGIAADAAGGVINAAGGMLGEGKSGNVKQGSTNQVQMVRSAINKKDSKNRSGSIADIQSTLADFSIPEGAMSILPTDDEGGGGLGVLVELLHKIAINTSYLGGIDTKIDALVGLSSISVIDQAQETKGGDSPPAEKETGLVRRTFNSLGDRLSGLSMSLGGTAKTLLKGLGLAGAFIFFKKFQPQITSLLASLMEGVSGFYDSLNKGGDPGDSLVNFFDNMMEMSILPGLITMAEKALETIFRAIKIGLNQILPSYLQFDDVGVVGTQTSSPVMSSFQNLVQSKGGMQSMGTIAGTGYMMPSTSGIEGTVAEQNIIGDAVLARLQFMYDNFAASDGRIRWTNIGSGFDSIMALRDGVRSLLGKYTVEEIFTSQPIVDGFIRPEADLDDPKLLQLPDFSSPTGEAEYIENLIENTRYKQKLLLGIKKSGLPGMLFRTDYGEEFDKNLQQNRLLLESGANLGNGTNGDTAMIDASHLSQHMHETNVTGLTSAINSNGDLVTFFNNNQYA